jgi:hypothetical protein
VPYDAPDWDRIVNIVAGPALTDAPDWERIVVGPGGTGIGGGGGSVPSILYPPDLGYIGWSSDPLVATNIGTGLNFDGSSTGGYIFFTMVKAVKAGTVTNLGAYVVHASTHTVANGSALGLYSVAYGVDGVPSSVSLLGSTGSGALGTAVASTGQTFVALSSGVTVTAGGLYFVGMLMIPTAGSVTGVTWAQGAIVPANGFRPFYANSYQDIANKGLLCAVSNANTYTSLPAAPALAAASTPDGFPWWASLS